MSKAPRWMAWCGELQVSPHPRANAPLAWADKWRWEKEHPDKLAEVREVGVTCARCQQPVPCGCHDEE